MKQLCSGKRKGSYRMRYDNGDGAGSIKTQYGLPQRTRMDLCM